MTPGADTPFSQPRTLAYAVGSLATGVFSTVPAVLLLYFCTQVLHIPPAAAAIIVFVPKAWSLLWDPCVGLWSDRAQTRWGRRRPFMVVGAAGVTASFLALFAWPYGGGGMAILGVAILYFLLATSYSLFAVPYVAVPGEVAARPSDRERLTAWRISFGLAGVLIGASGAPLIVAWAGGGRHGYAVMGLAVAAICGAAMFCAALATPLRHVEAQRGSAADVWSALRNGAFRQLLCAYTLQLGGIGLLNALAPYWIVFKLQRPESQVGLVLGGMLALAVVVTPLWAWIVRRVGGRTAIAIAAIGYGVLTLALQAAPAGPDFETLRLGLFVAIGLPFSGLQVAPFALLAHVVHDHAEETGRQQQALMTGLWTAGEKVGLALGAGAAGLGLSAAHFMADVTPQPPEVLDAIGRILAVGPAAFMLASLFFLAGGRKASARGRRPGPSPTTWRNRGG